MRSIGFFERRECFIALAQRDINHCQRHRREVLFRLVSLEDLSSLIALAHMRVSRSQKYLRASIVLTQLDRLLVFGDGFPILPDSDVERAEAFVRTGMAFVQFNELLLKFKRLSVLAEN